MITIREQIIECLITQLETITFANGYATDIGVGNVYRSVAVLEQQLVPAISVWEQAEMRERNKFGGTVKTLTVRIEGLVDARGDRHPNAVANALLGDLEKALMLSDTSLDPLIDDIQDIAAEIAPFNREQQLAGAIIEFEIQYTTEWGNPYNTHNY